jgi:hypothetical protein
MSDAGHQIRVHQIRVADESSCGRRIDGKKKGLPLAMARAALRRALPKAASSPGH